MKIDLKLPKVFACKWRRLLAYQGGDPEALALSAVELLWEKYGKDVEQMERAHRKMIQRGKNELRKADRAIAKSRRRLQDIPDVFVGKYELNADSKGTFTLPEELRFMSNGEYRLVSHNETFSIAPAAFAKGRKITFTSTGKFTLPHSVTYSFGHAKKIALIGKMRYLAIG